MKTLTITQVRRLFITMIILTFCAVASAQEPKEPTQRVEGTEIVDIKSSTGAKAEPQETKYTYKGKKVYRGSKGGLFVYMTAKKSGKVYKKYLKI